MPAIELDSVMVKPFQSPTQSKINNKNLNGSNVTEPSKPPAVTVQAVSNTLSPALEAQRGDLRQLNREHQARHKRRIRIARGIQHLLTALLSISVAVMQGRTYILYQQTKGVPGTWPSFVNLLPTLMLFVTALVATVVDLCAIIAYAWPQTRAGSVAFKVCCVLSFPPRGLKRKPH